MSLALLYQSMYASALANQSAGQIFSANQSRLALANQAAQFGATAANDPNAMVQFGQIAKMDQALELQSIQAKNMYLASLAMQEGAKSATKEWAKTFGLLGD